MRFYVDSGALTREDAHAFLIGIACAVLLDFAWLGIVTRYFIPVYDRYFDAISIRPKPVVAIVCAVAYATLASACAMVFVAKTPGDAMAAGALVGVWVFGAYNITMVAMTPTNSSTSSNTCSVSSYPMLAVFIDTAYGTFATSMLFFAQHTVRKA